MELFMTESHYIVQDGEFSLWCERSSGKLVPKEGMVDRKFCVILSFRDRLLQFAFSPLGQLMAYW